jgi:hypothetical protein
MLQGDRVACDHDGCDDAVAFRILRPGAADRFTSEPMPRRLARKEGWRVDDDGDFCPRHSERWEIRDV